MNDKNYSIVKLSNGENIICNVINNSENTIEVEAPLKLETHATPEKPVLVDKFLEGAVELDVDLISDGKNVVIGAIMEQIEMGLLLVTMQELQFMLEIQLILI